MHTILRVRVSEPSLFLLRVSEVEDSLFFPFLMIRSEAKRAREKEKGIGSDDWAFRVGFDLGFYFILDHLTIVTLFFDEEIT